jgi:hypothetical protein
MFSVLTFVYVGRPSGRYLAAVSQLVSWASELGPSLPWLINTMGWCKGLGLLLMKGTCARNIVGSETATMLYVYKKLNSFQDALSA